MANEILLQVGVKILIKNKEGKYLLLRRSVEKYPEVENRWDVVGGRINAGVNLLENLKREVREETNLELIGEPKLLSAQDILKNPGKHVVRLTYLGEAEGEIKLDETENDQYQWFALDELKNSEDINFYLKELIDSKF